MVCWALPTSVWIKVQVLLALKALSGSGPVLTDSRGPARGVECLQASAWAVHGVGVRKVFPAGAGRLGTTPLGPLEDPAGEGGGFPAMRGPYCHLNW